MNNVTLINKEGEAKSFNEFCRSFCQVNEPVRQFYVNDFIYLTNTSSLEWSARSKRASTKASKTQWANDFTLSCHKFVWT
jgi:hypothetical protein